MRSKFNWQLWRHCSLLQFLGPGCNKKEKTVCFTFLPLLTLVCLLINIATPLNKHCVYSPKQQNRAPKRVYKQNFTPSVLKVLSANFVLAEIWRSQAPSEIPSFRIRSITTNPLKLSASFCSQLAFYVRDVFPSWDLVLSVNRKNVGLIGLKAAATFSSRVVYWRVRRYPDGFTSCLQQPAISCCVDWLESYLLRWLTPLAVKRSLLSYVVIGGVCSVKFVFSRTALSKRVWPTGRRDLKMKLRILFF